MREDKYARHWHTLAFVLDNARGKLIDEIQRELKEIEMPVTARTVRRDLQMLQAAGFPVYSEKTARGTVWKVSENFRNIPSIPFSPLEALALLVAKNAFSARGETFFCNLLQGILEKLGRRRPAEFQEHLDRMQESVYCQQPSTPCKPSLPGYYDQIMKGIQKRLKLKTDYRNALGKISRNRILAPLHLWIRDQRSYLVAYCYSNDQVRVFSLSRFQRIEVTNESFTPVWDFDLERYAGETMGVFHAEPETVEMEVSDVLKDYFPENPLHPSQTVRKVQGITHLTLHVGINETLIHELMGFGSLIRVRSPRKLADLLLERHRQAADGFDAASSEYAPALPLEFVD
jgi:predicted DNA-binding transcriptional regulator YafY